MCRAAPLTVIKKHQRHADFEENITKRNKKEWTKSWFVQNKSSFATICKELTVKLYTKDIKNYIRMPV